MACHNATMFLLLVALLGLACYCYWDYLRRVVCAVIGKAKRCWFDYHVKYPVARFKRDVPKFLWPIADYVMKLDRNLYELDYSTIPKHTVRIVQATLYVAYDLSLTSDGGSVFGNGTYFTLPSIPEIGRKVDVTDYMQRMWNGYNCDRTASLPIDSSAFNADGCVLSVRYLSDSHKAWGGRSARESQHIYFLKPNVYATFPPNPLSASSGRVDKVVGATFDNEDVTDVVIRLVGPTEDFYQFTDDPHTLLKVHFAIYSEANIGKDGGKLSIEFC